ncbi:hypothetical protein [Paracoccus aestuariivivens]|uniref:Uncharacterized protein n=1 Tax=Paracoccus aestuariivivens TaxID=1820333 RepID=A0A6L6JGM8_9RHOB|nr:hypothetical protein [Paracoccus aestuariivivens]MTH79021.1 hypothetical protein [Paracoccus aestuariivivens]
MNRIALVSVCSALIGLTACGTPEQRCQGQVTAEYRNVSRLLQEVEDNIARGYAWENEPVRNSGISFCAGGYGGRYYGAGFGYGGCYGGTDVVRKRVPIDPASEARKRDALQQRLNTLSTQGNATCATRYGTDNKS